MSRRQSGPKVRVRCSPNRQLFQIVEIARIRHAPVQEHLPVRSQCQLLFDHGFDRGEPRSAGDEQKWRTERRTDAKRAEWTASGPHVTQFHLQTRRN